MLRTLEPAELLARRTAPPAPERARRVAEILDDVRLRGDDAVRSLTRVLDGVDLAGYRVGEADLAVAHAGLAPSLRDAIRLAAARVRSVCQAERPPGLVEPPPHQGVAIRLWREPLRRVAAYVPSGRAPLPSSVIMGVTPAQVAGVREIAVLTPPGPTGRGDPMTLAACAELGVSEVYLVGGAQAVAAAAYGTPTLGRVDLIAGPGNAWVTEAKRQVQGLVGIDGLNGPSEVLIWAEPPAPAAQIAQDLLAQAEHDPESVAILVTASPELLGEVSRETLRLAGEAGQDRLLLQEGVGAVLVPDAEAARRFIQSFAPEHLELWGEATLAGRAITSAGATFLDCPTPLGDYAAGANHVLPTGGSARFASSLGVETFMRRRTETRLVGDAGRVFAAAEQLAGAEGLEMHRRALRSLREVSVWKSAQPVT